MYEFLFLIFLSSGVSKAIQPPSNLQTSDIRKRSVSYSFIVSPTSGVTYKVIFTHQREGIPQPTTDTFDNVALRNKSGLTPDVTYRLLVVAVKGGEESTPISVNVTTKPDCKTAVYTTAYVCKIAVSNSICIQ